MKEHMENQIDAYLLGRMQSDELKEFENRLLRDKELAQGVETRRQLLQYIDTIGEAALKNRVQAVHQSAKKTLSTNRTHKTVRFLKYAAAVLTLITASYFLMRSFAPKQNIYDTYYQAYDLSFGTREEGSSDDEVLTLAGRLYSNGNYVEALQQFNALPDSLINAKINLAKGISYLESSQYSNAIATLQLLIDAKDPVYEGHARWYQAMTYIKSNKRTEAKILLQQIAAESESFNQQQAKEILNLLE